MTLPLSWGCSLCYTQATNHFIIILIPFITCPCILYHIWSRILLLFFSVRLSYLIKNLQKLDGKLFGFGHIFIHGIKCELRVSSSRCPKHLSLFEIIHNSTFENLDLMDCLMTATYFRHTFSRIFLYHNM